MRNQITKTRSWSNLINTDHEAKNVNRNVFICWCFNCASLLCSVPLRTVVNDSILNGANATAFRSTIGTMRLWNVKLMLQPEICEHWWEFWRGCEDLPLSVGISRMKRKQKTTHTRTRLSNFKCSNFKCTNLQVFVLLKAQASTPKHFISIRELVLIRVLVFGFGFPIFRHFHASLNHWKMRLNETNTLP